MKTLILLLIMPFMIYAQQDSTKVKTNKQNAYIKHKIVVDFLGYVQFPIAMGSKYFGKNYRYMMGTSLGLRLSYRGLYGIGGELMRNVANPKNKDSQYLGYNTFIIRNSIYAFGQIRVIDDLNAELKIGIGYTKVSRVEDNVDAALNYKNFVIGGGFYYSLTDTNAIKLFLNCDFNFGKAEGYQDIPNPGSFEFSRYNLAIVTTGIKFSFW